MLLNQEDLGSRASLALIKAARASGSVDEDRVKFQNLTAENGVTFDEDGNVVANEILDRTNIMIEVLGVTTNTVDHRLELDASVLSNKLDAIAELFGVVFNADGTIDTNDYDGHTHTESDVTDLGDYSAVGHTHIQTDVTDFDHTHAYEDNDGTVDTTRETSGVS